MRLGRRAVKQDSRTLRVGAYLTESLEAPPISVDWTKGVKSFGMMLNDTLGCCTIAGAGHADQIFTLNAGTESTVTDAVVQSYYSLWDGYVAGNAATDNGGVELDVLNAWQKQGFAGHALTAFADPKVTNAVEVRQAIALFGGVYIGVELPNSAQDQVGKVWDTAPWYSFESAAYKAGSWGGHCVFVTGYDADGLTCITWGALQRMTWSFWNRYVDEAHALLSPDFLGANGLDPDGFDMAQLTADLALIK
jgi:hypothetical protein